MDKNLLLLLPTIILIYSVSTLYKIAYFKIKLVRFYNKTDRNKNGIPDPLDLVLTARKEVEKKVVYRNRYYQGGYPPRDEGICCDIIWRAFRGIGVELKELVDKDIEDHLSLYPRVDGQPDPNSDFRRVANLKVFFDRHAQHLTTRLKPWCIKNLKQWQPGDIVIIMKPYKHIALISDRRTLNGVPYLIHMEPPYATEIKYKALWKGTVAGHYRWRY